ncbi:MAG: hypothetical protein MK078_16505 [Crocinitomicaceae bacterium]|nr:hypothetical protein [Crocinitomicaceae bacterium]
MKKGFLFAVIAIVASFTSFANPVAVLEDNAEHYTQTENGYIVNFDLQATSDEYLDVTRRAEENSRLLTLTAVEDGINNYHCVLTINHQNHPEYVHKMMVALGITTLLYKEATHPIIYIVDILKSYE